LLRSLIYHLLMPPPLTSGVHFRFGAGIGIRAWAPAL